MVLHIPRGSNVEISLELGIERVKKTVAVVMLAQTPEVEQLSLEHKLVVG
jgi:hypothetical protein